MPYTERQASLRKPGLVTEDIVFTKSKFNSNAEA